ncbi:hypothetical protein LTR53_020029, partial [Teratosphaeriaceae sp. CCFEE 6253]
SCPTPSSSPICPPFATRASSSGARTPSRTASATTCWPSSPSSSNPTRMRHRRPSSWSETNGAQSMPSRDYLARIRAQGWWRRISACGRSTGMCRSGGSRPCCGRETTSIAGC